MKVTAGKILILAITVGLLIGVFWLNIGERLDGIVGKPLAWFIFPLIISVSLSIGLYINDTESVTKFRISHSLLFFIIELSFHWVPFLIVSNMYLG